MALGRQDHIDKEMDKLDKEWENEFGPVHKEKEKEKQKIKRVIPISNYSFNGKGELHEAVIMSNLF